MIKLPKVYHCNGLQMKIVRREESTAARSFIDREEIVIDRDEDRDIHVVAAIIHEMLEVSLLVRGLRYMNLQDEYKFVFNHSEYQAAMYEVARGVYDLVQINSRGNDATKRNKTD